jgi:hypothetical protein
MRRLSAVVTEKQAYVTAVIVLVSASFAILAVEIVFDVEAPSGWNTLVIVGAVYSMLHIAGSSGFGGSNQQHSECTPSVRLEHLPNVKEFYNELSGLR